ILGPPYERKEDAEASSLTSGRRRTTSDARFDQLGDEGPGRLETDLDVFPVLPELDECLTRVFLDGLELFDLTLEVRLLRREVLGLLLEVYELVFGERHDLDARLHRHDAL